MKILVTEYLRIDLDRERWECRRCHHDIAPARENYKQGLLVYARDPREIHRPLINPEIYPFTFAPDPNWCAILEYYCPRCAVMVETEYTVPGHPPVHDIEFDIDALKMQWSSRQEIVEAIEGPPPPPRIAHHHGHSHDKGARP